MLDLKLHTYSSFQLESTDKYSKKSKDMDFLESGSDPNFKYYKESDNIDSFDSIFNKELDLDIGKLKTLSFANPSQ